MKSFTSKIEAFLSFLALFSVYSCSQDKKNRSPSTSHYKTYLNGTLGLNPRNLKINGISIGFLPAFGEVIAPNTVQEINAKLPEPMAIVGDYIELDVSDPKLSNIDEHLVLRKGLPGNPIWEMALMPIDGLESVTQEVSDRIGKKMKWLNDQGIIVWLRFAHEMNGDWYKWGGKPELFLKKWRMLAYAVKSRSSNTYMLWAPNSQYGPLYSKRGGYARYWPGKKYVDVIGLSFYHYGGYERLNILPTPGKAKAIIKRFADLYGNPYNLPVVLSETGASYTRSLQNGKPASGGASESDIKLKWLRQLLSKDLRRDVPLFKAISWFEVKKNENAAGNSAVKSEDFRLLMGNPTVSNIALDFIRSKSQ